MIVVFFIILIIGHSQITNEEGSCDDCLYEFT